MGTERKVPEFPYGLRGRGKRFWREIWASYDLEKDEAELFVEVCRSLDLVEDRVLRRLSTEPTRDRD